MIFFDSVSVQDRDLFGRMSQYFASFEARLREGQGWLIFTAGRERSNRITRFIGERLGERRPFVSYYFVPWRDFALNAYMVNVELPNAPPPPTDPADRVAIEHDIAGRVSRDQFYQMRYTDVLVISGLRLDYPHEIVHLDVVLTDRLTRRLPIILLTPQTPRELSEKFSRHSGGEAIWNRLYKSLYDTSLIAL